jgi:hypothetical protein
MATGRNSAGINKAGGKNVNPVYKAVNTLTSYVGNAAREIRDIPTAIGTGRAGEIKMQIKEAAAAVTAGQRGRAVQHVKANSEQEWGTTVRGTEKRGSYSKRNK